MKNFLILYFILLSSLGFGDPLSDAVQSTERDTNNVLRDIHRNPYETLSFFEIKPSMTVIELSPGGGWYTEILANYLNKSGNLIAAHFDKNSSNNWLGSTMDEIFMNSYKSLKPGGIFGVVEHRAASGTSFEAMKKSGYVTEEHAIKIAKKHGFELVKKSEINSNARDSKNYPKGVWTLPPSLRMKDVNKEKYLNIGESDRMTLLFRKVL